jgi:hypothetical protein
MTTVAIIAIASEAIAIVVIALKGVCAFGRTAFFVTTGHEVTPLGRHVACALGSTRILGGILLSLSTKFQGLVTGFLVDDL